MGSIMKLQEMRDKRIIYQENKKQEVIKRIASILSDEERAIFLSGDGFVMLPEVERARLKIDAYPYFK